MFPSFAPLLSWSIFSQLLGKYFIHHNPFKSTSEDRFRGANQKPFQVYGVHTKTNQRHRNFNAWFSPLGRTIWGTKFMHSVYLDWFYAKYLPYIHGLHLNFSVFKDFGSFYENTPNWEGCWKKHIINCEFTLTHYLSFGQIRTKGLEMLLLVEVFKGNW